MSTAAPRIVMLTHYYAEHRGGIEIVAGALGDEFVRRGVDITWLACDEGFAGPPLPRRHPLRASNFAERRIGIPYPVLLPSAFRAIFMEVRAADVVLVHDGLYMTSVAGFIAARLQGKPFIVIQHIGEVPYRNPVLKWMMRSANALVARPLLAWADRVAFISEITRRYFSTVRFRHPPTLVFNGVDTQIFRPAGSEERVGLRAKLGLPADRKLCLFVGRFVEKKGLPVLERLARAMPDVQFAFAGWGALDPSGWGLPNVQVFAGLSGASLADLYR